MRQELPRLAVVLLALCTLGTPWRALAADPDVEAARKLYEHASYPQALERARAAIDRGGASREELVELHKYAGLAAYNLADAPTAERHLSALLRLDPDYTLDPFAVAPPAIAFFEEIRKRLEPQLEVIRQQLRAEAERRKQDAEARARRQREEEERRRRLDELSRRLTIRTVERRSFLVNLVPFGAGQFQQRRVSGGVMLAAGQGAAVLTSVIAYFAHEALVEESGVVVDTVKGPIPITYRHIPKERQGEASVWKWIHYASAGAFFTLYGYGAVDAIYHHQDEVVNTTTEQLPPEVAPPQPIRRRPAEGPQQTPPPQPEQKQQDTVPLGPSVTGSATDTSLLPFFFPTPGGIGAGVQLQF